MTTAKLKLTAGLGAAMLLTAGAVELAVSGPAAGDKESPGTATEEEKGFAKELMQATADENYKAFMAHANADFKMLKEADFKEVSDQVKTHLKAGYHVVFLGGLKKDGAHETVWKIVYDDGNADDLMQMYVVKGKIAGALLQ